MLEGVVLEDGVAHGNTDAVITTQRSARRHDPLVVDDAGLEALLLGVDRTVLGADADHIHVALEADGRSILATYGFEPKERSYRE